MINVFSLFFPSCFCELHYFWVCFQLNLLNLCVGICFSLSSFRDSIKFKSNSSYWVLADGVRPCNPRKFCWWKCWMSVQGGLLHRLHSKSFDVHSAQDLAFPQQQLGMHWEALETIPLALCHPGWAAVDGTGLKITPSLWSWAPLDLLLPWPTATFEFFLSF